MMASSDADFDQSLGYDDAGLEGETEEDEEDDFRGGEEALEVGDFPFEFTYQPLTTVSSLDHMPFICLLVLMSL